MSRPPVQWALLTAFAALLLGMAALTSAAGGTRQVALLFIGVGLGVALHQARFGFAAAWRDLLTGRSGRGVAGQLLLCAAIALAAIPATQAGGLLGRPVAGAVAPIGLSLLFGAFLFGVGTQLAGGCATGALFAAAGGSSRLLLALLGFVPGSFIGTLHLPWWLGRPELGSVSLAAEFGSGPAVAMTLAACGLLAWLLFRVGRGQTREQPGGRPPTPPSLRGPWPLWLGVAVIAFLAIATLQVAGHTWTTTFAFSLWGAKLAQAAGADLSTVPYWTWPFPAAALGRSVLADTTSIMNIGILLGAAVAAAVAGSWRIGLVGRRTVFAALAGGLLMGYGARLAFGCNVGAFIGGVSSGSLHGWVWLLAALAGAGAAIHGGGRLTGALLPSRQCDRPGLSRGEAAQ